MIDTLFDLPLWIAGLGIILFLSLFAIAGLLLVRRCVLPRLRIGVEDSEFSGTMVQSVMVFYGLAVALIAVSVWQSYSDAAGTVSHEATALAALYRDISGYPEPIRALLQSELRDYVQYVIHEAWPQQRRGEIPGEGVERMNVFQKNLFGFQPVTESEIILHGEALRAYNHMIEARRQRLEAVQTGLPPVMWMVILAGPSSVSVRHSASRWRTRGCMESW